MEAEIRQLINNITQDIIDSFQIVIPIKDIEAEVCKLGGKIEENYSIDSAADGLIRKQGDGFTIVVSPFQSEERRRFTIAHELGHLFLHMGYKINNELWEKQDERTYYRTGDSMLEYQANEFAAALLMPRKQYKEEMDKNTDKDGITVDTGRIAEHFGVSVSAASNRGKFLGYLKW